MGQLYLIVDVEATCWESSEAMGKESEIIELGAVLFDTNTKIIKEEFQSFVKPVREPILSSFCTNLTSIRQKNVDAAPIFPEVVFQLKEGILDHYRILFCSWGNYDREQVKADCRFHKIKYPFGKHHLNIKQLYADLKSCRPCGMAQALRMLYLDLEGTHHRAIYDARNIARILTRIL